MRILYLHQYFITPAVEGGTRSYEFARYFARCGHDVTVLHSGLMNEQMPCPSDQPYVQRSVDGIQALALPAGYCDARHGTAMSGSRRMLKFLEFSRACVRVGKTLPRPDVIFATHTPLPIGLAGMKLARHFGVPFVFEVRDLWPDALVNIGALRNPLVIWWLRRMEKRIYRAADHIVALSPGMKDGIVRAGTPPEKVTVIPNSSDLDLFNPNLDGAEERRRLGLGDRFAAIYFGAMGHANGLEYALDAAKTLKQRGRKDIVIVLHGAGGKREELIAQARREALDNVVFSSPVPDKKQMARIVAACNACLTIYRATKEQSWSPNKMFDALAAGRPVLINVKGWLGETVEENACGRSLSPGNAVELADALEHLADHPEEARKMGQKARQLGEREFARERLAARLEKVLADAVAAHK